MTVAAFALPPALQASEPPERRGLARDEVRLLVAARASEELIHARFRRLPQHLRPGDLLVINTSATLPAAVPARRADGETGEVRFSTPPRPPANPGRWVVELRGPAGEPLPGTGQVGERIALPGEAEIELRARYAGSERLWLARVELDGVTAPIGARELHRHLHAHGHPIRYGHVPRGWPLGAYQTVYATHPGSAEMPSAGRPFTPELFTRLAARGVLVAPLTLHCGVSSPERDEPPFAEPFAVPAETARLVNAVRGWGGRVIAVGTTVVRALESAVTPRGDLEARTGWTELVITPERPPVAVDGLITGWHEPGASHLQMLEGLAGEELVERSYGAALAAGYLWHEFGDSHLILP